MLDNGVTILIREDCKVILCAQVRLILCTLLVTCECVVFHTQGHEALVLEVAHWESQINLYEVSVGNDELSRIKAALTLTSVKVISSWESRVFHSSLVVSVRCSHVYILWIGV